MEAEQICCLCIFSCNNYKFIQNERGDSTDIYDVTVKYFDPMILTEEQSCALTLSRVICCGCWSHIFDFHEFQQRVLKSRTLLRETNVTKDLPHLIKVESEDVFSDDGMPDRESSVRSASDQEDEIPLISLFQETRGKQSAVTMKGDEIPLDDNAVGHCNAKIEPALVSAEKSFNREISISSEFSIKKDSSSCPVKIEDQPEVNAEIFSTKIKIHNLSPYENQCEKLCKNDKGIIENTKAKPKIRMSKKRLNEEQAISSQSNSCKKVLVSVRKKNKNKTKLLTKAQNSANSKLMEKCKENDIFISKWKPILDCDLCPTTVSNFGEMRDHFRVAHNTRSYVKCCERKFYRRYVLIDHIRLHVNPETHKCDICGKHSTTKYNLKLHKQVVHSESKQFECEVCNRLFNQKPTLDRHLLTHIKGEKKFFCKECGKGYFVEDQLKYHMKTVHSVDRVCDQCGKTIHGLAALKKHLMEHAGIARPKFPCDICGAELVTNYGLRRHKAAYHHDGSTAYVCSICGKVASSQNALMSHKKNVHENGKNYKCTYCDKAFKRSKVLREHIATHTGVDLYQCPHCPQTFKVSANMHHHRKRAHPVEWEEGRKNRTALPKVNIKQVTNQIVL